MTSAIEPPTSALLAEIRELLDAPATGATAPLAAKLEDTLTAGYARALEIEAERWRLERRITEVAARAADDETATDELSTLARAVAAADFSLTHLRQLLAPLQARARAARA